MSRRKSLREVVRCQMMIMMILAVIVGLILQIGRWFHPKEILLISANKILHANVAL